MFKPIKTLSIIDQVSEQMTNLILDGTLRPGDLFPAEVELAEQLNVSRTVIRESKKSLIGMGLLETREKRTYVRSDIFDAAVDLFSLGFRLEPGSVEELIDARRVIETGAVVLAAKRANDEILAKLRRLLDQQKDAIEKGDKAAFAESDLEWHSTITKAAQNRLLAKMVLTIHNMLGVLIATTLEVPESDKDAYAAHKKITEAISNHDADAARNAMNDHLNHIQGIINRLMAENNDVVLNNMKSINNKNKGL